jgi:hypothetical protein
MMTQEEFMNVKALRAAGWTVAQIARHLGYHPATVSSWLKAGGPPAKRSVPVEELVVDERWRERIGATVINIKGGSWRLREHQALTQPLSQLNDLPSHHPSGVANLTLEHDLRRDFR